MTTVYDLIDEICRLKNLSMRQLAINSALPPSTIVSIQARRSPQISKRVLAHLGHAFDLEWHDLITLPENVLPEQITTQKVPADLSEEDKVRVLQHIESFQVHNLEPNMAVEWKEKGFAILDEDRETNAPFLGSIKRILEKMNEEGLMEVLRFSLEIANDPKYCKETKKED